MVGRKHLNGPIISTDQNDWIGGGVYEGLDTFAVT
jgi:hypothetical protein